MKVAATLMGAGVAVATIFSSLAPAVSADLVVAVKERSKTCAGSTGMGNPQLWHQGIVINPVSKTQIPIGLGAGTNWRTDPYDSNSWRVQLHGLAWVRGLVDQYRRTSDQASLDLAIATIRSHIQASASDPVVLKESMKAHPVSLRLDTISCLASVIGLPEDISAEAERLAAWQLTEKNYAINHNHGLMQNLSLARLGCATNRADLIDAAWIRMLKEIEFVVDEQGANNEQSTGYAEYNKRKWTDAIGDLAACDEVYVINDAAQSVIERISKLGTFIQQTTQPDGMLVPIGNTYGNRQGDLSLGGQPLVAYYSMGYAMGRSNWNDPSAMYWTLRFGPKRMRHGHEDRMSVTYFVNGGRVLVDGGHSGHDKNSLKAYLMSPDAHNAPQIVGKKFKSGSKTDLLRANPDPVRATFTVADKSYGVTRTRHLLADNPSKTLATLDYANGSEVLVPWSVDPSLKVAGYLPGLTQIGGTRAATIVTVDAETCAPLMPTAESKTIASNWRTTAQSQKMSVQGKRVFSVITPGLNTYTCQIAPTGDGVVVTVSGPGYTSTVSAGANGLS